MFEWPELFKSGNRSATCGRYAAVFGRPCPLPGLAADVFPTGSSAALRLGPREPALVSPCFLISLCRIEEVCGRAQTYISASGFAPRITTAGRDGKTHRGSDRKRHVVLLPHFGGGIKGCGDILVLAVRRRRGTALPALHLTLDRLEASRCQQSYQREVSLTCSRRRAALHNAAPKVISGVLFSFLFAKIPRCCACARFGMWV